MDLIFSVFNEEKVFHPIIWGLGLGSWCKCYVWSSDLLSTIRPVVFQQTHLEEEIEQLRTENTNLTRVAELMTTNMRESVTTSKK